MVSRAELIFEQRAFQDSTEMRALRARFSVASRQISEYITNAPFIANPRSEISTKPEVREGVVKVIESEFGSLDIVRGSIPRNPGAWVENFITTRTGIALVGDIELLRLLPHYIEVKYGIVDRKLSVFASNDTKLALSKELVNDLGRAWDRTAGIIER